MGQLGQANLDGDLGYSPIRITQSRTCCYLGTTHLRTQSSKHSKTNNVPVIKVTTREEGNPTLAGKRMGSEHAKQYSLWDARII